MKPPNPMTSIEPVTPPKTARSLVATVLLAVVGGAVLAGCGHSTSPGQSVPALDTSLDRVDTAISTGHLGQARSAVNGLIETTRQARRSGDISAGDASRILPAAQELVAQLPAQASTPQPSPTPSPAQTTSPPHENGGNHGDNGHDHKKHEGRGHNGNGEND